LFSQWWTWLIGNYEVNDGFVKGLNMNPIFPTDELPFFY